MPLCLYFDLGSYVMKPLICVMLRNGNNRHFTNVDSDSDENILCQNPLYYSGTTFEIGVNYKNKPQRNCTLTFEITLLLDCRYLSLKIIISL